jgi:hypothetical protein
VDRNSAEPPGLKTCAGIFSAFDRLRQGEGRRGYSTCSLDHWTPHAQSTV